jgi:hypothetical protein
VNNEWKGIWKERVLTYLKVLVTALVWGAWRISRNTQRKLVSGPGFESTTCLLRSRNTSSSTWTFIWVS